MKGNKEIRAGVGYTMGNILIKGVSFLSLPIFSRLLTTSQYGTFNTFTAYGSIISIFLGLGMYASIKNARYDFPNRVELYVSTILRLTLYALIAMIGLVFMFHENITTFTGFSVQLLLILLFQSYGSALLSISNAKLTLNYNYKKYLAFALFNTVVGVGLSIILIQFVFVEQREVGRILGSSLPLIIIAIYIFVSEGNKARFRINKEMVIYALSFGLPMIWHYLSQSIQSQIDRIMISKMVNTASTGIYSFSYGVAVILQVIYYSIENVWSVWFYEQMDKGNYHVIRPALKKYILLVAVIASIMLIGSKEFIMLMADEEYWSGSDIFIPCLLGIFMLFLYTIPAGVEYYYKKTKYIALMTSIAAIVNITMNYILIRRFGYKAAAFATMISYAVTFLGHWNVAQKLLREHIEETIFKLSDFVKPYVVLVVIGGGVFWLNSIPLLKYILFFIGGVIVAVKHKEDIIMLKEIFFGKLSK